MIDEEEEGHSDFIDCDDDEHVEDKEMSIEKEIRNMFSNKNIKSAFEFSLKNRLVCPPKCDQCSEIQKVNEISSKILTKLRAIYLEILTIYYEKIYLSTVKPLGSSGCAVKVDESCFKRKYQIGRLIGYEKKTNKQQWILGLTERGGGFQRSLFFTIPDRLKNTLLPIIENVVYKKTKKITLHRLMEILFGAQKARYSHATPFKNSQFNNLEIYSNHVICIIFLLAIGIYSEQETNGLSQILIQSCILAKRKNFSFMKKQGSHYFNYSSSLRKTEIFFFLSIKEQKNKSKFISNMMNQFKSQYQQTSPFKNNNQSPKQSLQQKQNKILVTQSDQENEVSFATKNKNQIESKAKKQINIFSSFRNQNNQQSFVNNFSLHREKSNAQSQQQNPLNKKFVVNSFDLELSNMPKDNCTHNQLSPNSKTDIQSSLSELKQNEQQFFKFPSQRIQTNTEQKQKLQNKNESEYFDNDSAISQICPLKDSQTKSSYMGLINILNNQQDQEQPYLLQQYKKSFSNILLSEQRFNNVNNNKIQDILAPRQLQAQKMKKSQNLEGQKDPENIYMSDIIHILKDQKQKIDHLLRQTRLGMQQSNSKVKGFWNSSNHQAEPFSIPSKVLNDIQGYETSAGRINSILHKKVNHLKRITMKKKTYEEIEKREREKEIFARFATPDVRMNMRSSIGSNILDQKQNSNSKYSKRYETTANTRASSFQLDFQQECLTTDAWSKRIQAAKEQHKFEETPLKVISNNNKAKQIGVLRRRNNEQLKNSLEEITKIYSPRSQQSQVINKQDQIHGQSMILDDQNVNRSSIDIARQTMDLGILNLNSTRSKKGRSQELDMLLIKNQFVDKENNQQYLLKQVQQQNSVLTQKQNEILYRQLLEESKKNQINQNSDDEKMTPKEFNKSSKSYQKAQNVQNEEKSLTRGDGFFLPSLNNKQRKEEDQEYNQSNYLQGELNQDIHSTQKKYANYAFGNIETPNNRYNQDQVQGSKDASQQNYSRFENEEDLSAKIRNFKQSQRNQSLQADQASKSKRSLSVQQHAILQNSQQPLIDTEDKFNLYNKYKQINLQENSSLRLPSENEIYPLNIINNDKKADGQNFFKKEQIQQKCFKEAHNNSENDRRIPGAKSSMNSVERSKRYSYDLNCNSVPLNTNQPFENEKVLNVSNNIINEPNTKKNQKNLEYFSTVNGNGGSSNNNHINQNQKQQREYTYQDTNQANSKINSTDLSGKKQPFDEIVQEKQKRNSQYNLNQDQSENIILTQDPQNNHVNDEQKQAYSKQSFQQTYHKVESQPQIQSENYQQEQQIYDSERDLSNKTNLGQKKREYEQENINYEFLPSQINFTVKKEDLKLDLSKLVQQRLSQQDVATQKSQIQAEQFDSKKLQPIEAISNEQINQDLKEKLQQNFLSRLGVPGGFLQIQQSQSKNNKPKNRKNINSNTSNRDGFSPSKQSSDGGNGKDKESTYRQKVKFNDPNLFNYHKLIGCANLDDKSKKIKPYQHYHSNEREKLEKRYYEILNEKLNYQIEINLLFLEQSLLKSKSQTKKQLLEKLKAFRQEIVEASQSQEKSIHNLKKQYKHLHSFNLPDSLFII
ncbi:hypothetical protein ABPG72_020436 [Tetrahymena utriculariae]